jgi:hypothetical protein
MEIIDTQNKKIIQTFDRARSKMSGDPNSAKETVNKLFSAGLGKVRGRGLCCQMV